MARLTAETKQIIRNFYKEKEKELRKSYDIYKQEFINYKIEEFENDLKVIEVKKLLNELSEKYNKKFEIYYSKYDVSYEESNNCKMIIDEINKIKRECDTLIVTLDYLPKNSEEYKEAYKKLNLILKGEM